MKKGDEKMNENVCMNDDEEMDAIVDLINEVIIENVITHEMIDDGFGPDEAEEFASNAARELVRD